MEKLNFGLKDLCWWPVPLLGRYGFRKFLPRLPAKHLACEYQFVLRLHDKLLNLSASHSLLKCSNILVLERIHLLEACYYFTWSRSNIPGPQRRHAAWSVIRCSCGRRHPVAFLQLHVLSCHTGRRACGVDWWPRPSRSILWTVWVWMKRIRRFLPSMT